MRTTLKNVAVKNTDFTNDSINNSKWIRFISYLNHVHNAGFSGGVVGEYYFLVDSVAHCSEELPAEVEEITLYEAINIVNLSMYMRSNRSVFVCKPSEYSVHWDKYIAELNELGVKHGISYDGTQDGAFYGILNGVPCCLGSSGFRRKVSHAHVVSINEGVELMCLIKEQNIYMENQIVTTYNGEEHPLSECLMLCDDSGHGGEYALINDTVHSRIHCGAILLEEASEDIRGDYFVTDLADNHDYVWSEYNDGYLCTEWIDVYYGNTGRRYEDYFMSDEYVYANGSYFVSSEVANDCGYFYDEDCDEWYHEDDERPSRVSNFNSGYHSGRGRGWKAGDKPKFTIGFEIEKEDNEAGCIPWQGVYGRTGWIKESDSSLDEDGYELVSPIFDLYTDAVDKEIYGDDELQTLIEASFSDERCGGHINLGSTMYTPMQLFEGLSSFMPLMYSMYPHRIDERYSKAKPKYVYQSEKNQYEAKYSSAYIKDQVVEFRIFPAVRSIKNLLWRRDLLRIMCDNINKSELDVLKMLVNQNSKLYKHMRKIYSQDELLEKTKHFIQYSEQFNYKKLPPIDPKKFKKGDDNITDSTDDLGA